VQSDERHARRDLAQSFHRARAPESGHVESEGDEIELTRRRSTQHVHRVPARFGFMSGGAQSSHQPFGHHAVIIANHYLRHPQISLRSTCSLTNKTRLVGHTQVNSHAAPEDDTGTPVK
jgi:hypothetical protein